MKFQVVYSEQQVSDPNQDPVHGIISPSAGKPKLVAAELKRVYPDLEFHPPVPLAHEDFYLCHDKNYVNGVFNKRRKNGFGTFSDSVNASLPYTNGAMYEACRIATPDKPAAALVSGFHHAGYAAGFEEFGYFCTFNGLMIAAMKMPGRVAIIDCDQHFGNGTDDIIVNLGCTDKVWHYTFGFMHHRPIHAARYLAALEPDGHVATALREFKPDLIIYQSGADVHVDDPMGGVLTEEQMLERDRRVFTMAKGMGVPLAWCLAGGYQSDVSVVVRLHMNTFRACEEVY